MAGSMRDAFGVQKESHYSGVEESEGLATRYLLKNAAHIRPEDLSVTPTPDEHGSSVTGGHGSGVGNDRAFALAAATLRQALADLPELTEASKRIMIEETKEGLNIEVVDQDGRSMFPQGSKEPYERTRALIKKLAGPLKATPYRISITGHTSGSASLTPAGLWTCWTLSTDRANAVRQILEQEDYPTTSIYEVAGKADFYPLFPDHPSVAPNRRVTITLMRETPPMPPGLQP